MNPAPDKYENRHNCEAYGYSVLDHFFLQWNDRESDIKEIVNQPVGQWENQCEIQQGQKDVSNLDKVGVHGRSWW
ncbi:MAG: hypothetical protein H7Y42_10155 [Chitinophagaceae bacterium]|nr:hypothetical protein [Chitinophagaceae bacterium]